MSTTPFRFHSERKPPSNLHHHKRRPFGKENPPVLPPKTFVNNLVSTIERRNNLPIIGRLIHDYHYSSAAHASAVRRSNYLFKFRKDYVDQLKAEFHRARARARLTQRHTDWANLNDYTYLQVRRIRPGPLSRVDRLFGVTPFTLDVAYHDFEPIPIQYTPL